MGLATSSSISTTIASSGCVSTRGLFNTIA
jgi:hypothetical protein